MSRTGIADENVFDIDKVITTSILRAGVDGVTVVNAFADRVELDDFDAHDSCGGCLLGQW